MRTPVLLALLALGAAPAAPAEHPTDEQCARLWDDTVDASAPDLAPTDEMRKSYLLREKLQLGSRCLAAGPAALACPAQAAARCRAEVHAPPDGGTAPGLARCVYPAVQECVQRDRIGQARTDGALDRLLAGLKSGELQPEKGTLKLKGELATLSLGGVALASPGQVVLLTFNERNTLLRGVLVAADPAALKALLARPEADRKLKVGGVEFRVTAPVDARSAEVASGGL